MAHCKGMFSVDYVVNPQLGDGAVGHMTFHKKFDGELDATSVVEMLHVQGGVKGSAVYVAIERISGTLQGRSGTFSAHHTGVMNRGASSLAIFIVPDSGTDQLEGLSGSMHIDIVDSKHYYTIDFSLPSQA